MLRGERPAHDDFVAKNVAVDRDAAPSRLATFSAKANLRVVRVGEAVAEPFEIRAVAGGALVQDPDAVVERRGEMTVASSREPTEEEIAENRRAAPARLRGAERIREDIR